MLDKIKDMIETVKGKVTDLLEDLTTREKMILGGCCMVVLLVVIL